MPSSEVRARLAEEQARLVRALTGQAESPADFDAGRLGAAAAALAHKRARSAARAWPALAHALGEGFEERFAEFVKRVPRPREGGPLADGRAFVADLAARGELPDEGRLEALGVDLHFRRTSAGLKPRRGPAVKVAWLRRSRKLALGIRLPWLGARWIILP